MNLLTTVNSSQDIMRTVAGFAGDAQRIGQLTWLLFLKIWDDREQEQELLNADDVSPLAKVEWRASSFAPGSRGREAPTRRRSRRGCGVGGLHASPRRMTSGGSVAVGKHGARPASVSTSTGTTCSSHSHDATGA